MRVSIRWYAEHEYHRARTRDSKTKKTQSCGGTLPVTIVMRQDSAKNTYQIWAQDQAPDIRRAISLYEQAWTDGVTIAAFELGNLYEHGVNRSDKNDEYVLAPDETRAWFWYQKARDAGEANALARLAARADGAAFSEENAAKKNSYWLESFKYYAAAADRARSEDWPDGAWRNWRYRRASLARPLAREGMMREIADAYEEVRTQYAPPPTIWERLTSPGAWRTSRHNFGVPEKGP
jgi:TPR repeat protein